MRISVMKIRMLTSLSGIDFSLSPGDDTEAFTDEEAIRLIKAGYAAPVAEAETEKATKRQVREKRG
jgi:hypothetical protein